MDSPNVSFLMPQTCDYVTSQVDIITYPEMGNLSWIVWGAGGGGGSNIITVVLVSMLEGRRVRDVMTEVEAGKKDVKILCCWLLDICDKEATS